MTTETTIQIAADDVYALATCRPNGGVDGGGTMYRRADGDLQIRNETYLREYEDQEYTIIATRNDLMDLDHSGEFNGESAPTDEWCEAMAEYLNTCRS